MFRNSIYTAFALIAIFMCSSNLMQAQSTDTTRYNIWNISAEIGVFFPHNNELRELYNHRSLISRGIGMQFGASDSRFIKWVKFSQYNSSLVSVSMANPAEDTIVNAIRKQLSLGLIAPIRISEGHYLQMGLGVSRNFITEGITGLDADPYGMIMFAGYSRRLSEFITIFVDLSYDHAKTNSREYLRDWSGLEISYGLNLNIYNPVKEWLKDK